MRVIDTTSSAIFMLSVRLLRRDATALHRVRKCPSTTCSEAVIPKPMDFSSSDWCTLDLGTTKSGCGVDCYDRSTRRPRCLLLS